MKTYLATRCTLCEQQPFLEDGVCPCCGATLQEVARWWSNIPIGSHLELVPKNHVEP